MRRLAAKREPVLDHLVRIGALGQIGRFRSTDAVRFRRGTSVICRTARGLEFGEVLNELHHPSVELEQAGSILRSATPQDHLLWARIKKHRVQAMNQCQQLLHDHRIATPLMDVELLFDGSSIFFYFVGPVSAELERLTTHLAQAYEAQVQLRQFAEAMTLGCGPDCGTKEGGCQDGGCSTCAISKSCASR